MKYRLVFLVTITVAFYSVNLRAVQSGASEPRTTFKQTEAITKTKNPFGWKIETASSVYQIALAQDNIVVPVYYGPRGQALDILKPGVKVDTRAGDTIQEVHLYQGQHGPFLELHNDRIKVYLDFKVGSTIREVPFRGGFVEQTPAVEVVFPDGTRDCELVYASSEIFEIDGFPCLRIDLKDPAYGLFVSSYIRVIPELDILEKWIVLTNKGTEPIRIENAQSGSVWLPPDEYELLHLCGKWGHEFMLQRTRLTPGVKTIQVRGFVANETPPWFAVTPADQGSETQGAVWFGGLHWSGNWRLDFEKNFNGNVQIIGGINFWDTTWQLKSKEQFSTPKMVFGFAPDGMTGASTRMHTYIRRHVLRPKFRNTLRPVLYNSWYATTFYVNEEQQLALARIAKEIGVELFVIDDGWFKGRVNDHAGLGDWTVDKKKFPNGLKPLIKKINDLGLDFGIWVEPEMVNPDSDLYRAHPEWALHYPKRTPHQLRHQLVLNLARQDVYDYLLESLTTLLRENNIRFIKWDRNRPLSEPGWPDAPRSMQREVRIRFIHNLYRLIDELRARFPEVLFETCSSGGGRNDLGIFSRMDQVWTSDNTDPVGRIMIQHGFLHAFPAKLMVSWITHEDWHNVRPSLRFRFHVSMSGVLGIGADLTTWSQQQRDLAAEMIAQYKQIRPVVQEGICHRLHSPFESNRAALEYVLPDGSQAVVFLYNLWETLGGSTPSARASGALHLRGLDPDANYSLTGDWQGTVDGRTLMNIGLPWFIRGNFNSAIVMLKRQTKQ